MDQNKVDHFKEWCKTATKAQMMDFPSGMDELDARGQLDPTDAVAYAIEYMQQEILSLAAFDSVCDCAAKRVLKECIAKLKEKEM